MKSKYRQSISVTLATYNEEGNIKECLDSVKDWVDEMIVVDGHSQDKTVEIAKKMGAKVLLRENNPIFHIQKQIGNNEAKSDWILQLDADERIPESLKGEIISLLEGKKFGYSGWISPLKKSINHFFKLFEEPKKLTEPAAAYWIPRSNFFLNRYQKHGGQYPDPAIRLFQKDKAYLPAKDVHEFMVVDGVVGWLTSHMDHYATPDFGRYLLRENRYSSISANQLREKNLKITPINTIKYLFFKPVSTFFMIYFRHRGFLDGFAGFVFALFSGLHHAFSYMKLWEIYKKEDLARDL